MNLKKITEFIVDNPNSTLDRNTGILPFILRESNTIVHRGNLSIVDRPGLGSHDSVTIPVHLLPENLHVIGNLTTRSQFSIPNLKVDGYTTFIHCNDLYIRPEWKLEGSIFIKYCTFNKECKLPKVIRRNLSIEFSLGYYIDIFQESTLIGGDFKLIKSMGNLVLPKKLKILGRLVCEFSEKIPTGWEVPKILLNSTVKSDVEHFKNNNPTYKHLVIRDNKWF